MLFEQMRTAFPKNTYGFSPISYWYVRYKVGVPSCRYYYPIRGQHRSVSTTYMTV